MATTTKQRLALAICDFLSTSLTDGTLSSEDKDSIDVAINCIGESFKVDPSDSSAIASAVGTQNLLQIYGVYEKLKTSSSAPSSSASKPNTAAAAAPDPTASPKQPTDAEKSAAEDLKAQGNRAMAAKDYPTAIERYTSALALHPSNAIYLSNRAAAYSAARDHASARADAEAAVRLDPGYTKAWSRLGLARFALGDAKGSMDAYRQGIEHEGNGGSDAMKKGFETARRRVEELDADAASSVPDLSGSAARGGGGGGPDLASLANLFGGGGGGSRDGGAAGGAGGGGMPDFGSIMNNPMFASMAQNLMSNPEMMQNLMSNPRLREMADRFSSGGGMPDLSTLMNDPNIADMARNMMGGSGDDANPGAGRGAGR